MKRAFTLIELLVVIGIIATLTAATTVSFSAMRKSAERAKARELCAQVKIALEAIWNSDGVWPAVIREKNSASDSVLDEEVAYVLAKRGNYSLTYDNEKKKTTGVDRFGILSPWGADVMKRNRNATLSTKVSGTSTIKDHLLRFKVDLDGDGIVKNASVGGEAIDIRATVAVWCAGKDGKMENYQRGLRSDDIHTWVPGQMQKVK